MIELKNVIEWNHLPAIVVDDEDECKIVVFSNVDGSFVLSQFPYEQKDDDNVRLYLDKQGFFKCLNTAKEYVADELTAIFSLTEKCNCCCRYCFLEANDCGATMPIELLYDGIDMACEIAKGRPINFAAFGGEPTVESHLIAEMVAYAKKKCDNARFSITTNGLFGTDVLNLLVEERFSVSLSMDGLPSIQNYQRPLRNNRNSYDLVEQNIMALVKSDCKLKVRCTITQFSVDYMVDIVRSLQNIGVKRIHFEPVTLGGRGNNNKPELQPPTPTQFVDNLILAIEEGGKYGVDIICFPYMNMMIAPVVFCDGRADNRLVISPRGIVSSCVEVQTKTHELFPFLGIGEYVPSESRIKLMYDQRREGKRGCHALTESKPICKMCPLKFFCGGGCPTRNYRGTGSTDVVDQYRCDIIRLIMPYVLNKYYQKTMKGG